MKVTLRFKILATVGVSVLMLSACGGQTKVAQSNDTAQSGVTASIAAANEAQAQKVREQQLQDIQTMEATKQQLPADDPAKNCPANPQEALILIGGDDPTAWFPEGTYGFTFRTHKPTVLTTPGFGLLEGYGGERYVPGQKVQIGGEYNDYTYGTTFWCNPRMADFISQPNREAPK